MDCNILVFRNDHNNNDKRGGIRMKNDYAPRTGSTKTDWFKVVYFTLSTAGVMSIIFHVAGIS